ncbi:uncharacterized protein CLUP02_06648 [Colletotrichum lupini]|uniref:Uncharacterized protein n=1 Tax=Colletotrichum lupini TaxID=145971 RepID=A0A9Q8SPJ8_9PEZI|nr:uncharacterized protein CLUP02_06648 [Colletotrichum lupini]UQC81162.1 hypothetical protein CLUP02_06648 [Colletotrichum lupini]
MPLVMHQMFRPGISPNHVSGSQKRRIQIRHRTITNLTPKTVDHDTINLVSAPPAPSLRHPFPLNLRIRRVRPLRSPPSESITPAKTSPFSDIATAPSGQPMSLQQAPLSIPADRMTEFGDDFKTGLMSYV